LRAPALLYVVCSGPRFIARTVLDESRLSFRDCLASEANIRKNSPYIPESAVCLEQTSDVQQGCLRVGVSRCGPAAVAGRGC